MQLYLSIWVQQRCGEKMLRADTVVGLYVSIKFIKFALKKKKTIK